MLNVKVCTVFSLVLFSFCATYDKHVTVFAVR